MCGDDFEAIFSMFFAFCIRGGEIGPTLNPNGPARAFLPLKYVEFAMPSTILPIKHEYLAWWPSIPAYTCHFRGRFIAKLVLPPWNSP